MAELCDRVAVMYAGFIVETGSVDDVFFHPRHRYMSLLLRALPNLESREATTLATIGGVPPFLANLRPGCPFAPRCDYAQDVCRREPPPFVELAEGHRSLCHFATEVYDETPTDG